MGLFAQVAREVRGYRLEQFSPQSTAYWVAKLFGGGYQTSAGINVTPETAMAIGAVYASCRNVAEDLAGLPLPVYRDNATTAGGMGATLRAPKIIDRSAPAFAILNKNANPEMTAMSFRETMHGHVLLRGDAFAEKELDQGLRVKALWPLNPARMRMARNGEVGFRVDGAAPGELFFIYTLRSGQEKVFAKDLIFHPRGFGPDGLRGYSIVSLAREGMGLSLATEAYGGRFFANDASPGIALTHPKSLSDKARTNIELSWKATHEGLDNAHRLAILEEGLSVERIGMPNVDAQFLETRKFQRDEIPMWFRMPPDKLGNYERATYANLGESDLAYMKYTLRSHGNRFEQQLAADNIVDADHYALHDYSDLLKADPKTRAEFYHSLRMDGAISGEDIRRLENLDPSGQPGADELLVALNMIPASAFQPNGMTLGQLAHAAYEMLHGGYEASAVNAFLGLGDLAHTGFVPGKATPDPGAATDGARSNGHEPDLALPILGSV
jgi:HK97 family phage portal protein